MKVVNVGEVKKVILNNKQIIRNYGVNKLGLFGSFVRDEQKENSDVDLLVDFDKDQNTFKNFMGFADFMEETLGRKVDVVTLQSLSPFIGPYILKEVKYVEVWNCQSKPPCYFVASPLEKMGKCDNDI